VKTLVVLTNLDIVSGSTDDATIKIWTINSEFSYRNKLEGHIGSINDLKFINNSDLASCSSDNSIRIWDINTSQVKSINLVAHNRSCLSLCLFNYIHLVSSSEDKSIKFWNTNLFYNISVIKGYSSLDNNNNNNNNYQRNFDLISKDSLWKIEYCMNDSSLNCKQFLSKLNELLDNF